MDILSFNKISKPRLECGIDIDLKPRGFFQVEVIRPDGTIRKPYGDQWMPNVVLNWFRDYLLSDMGYAAGNGGGGMGSNYSNAGFKYLTSLAGFINSGTAITVSPSTGGGTGAQNQFIQSALQIGTSSTAAANTQTGLISASKISNVVPTGNSITYRASTGEIVITAVRQFAQESGAATYNEAAIYSYLTYQNAPANSGPSVLPSSRNAINRVVFPSPLSVTAGETIVLRFAMVLQTLAVNAQTVTIAAQNGMNISGQLKCVGTLAAMAGGSVTSDGILTVDRTYALLPNVNENPVFGLSSESTFPSAFTAAPAMSSNNRTGAWAPYTAGSYIRDAYATWPVGTPAADTNFRSITFCNPRLNTGGYQLLLDSQMTKAASASLTFGLRFSV